MEYLQLTYIARQQQDKENKMEEDDRGNQQECPAASVPEAPDTEGPILGEDGEI